MNTVLKITLWVLVYAALGCTLYDGIRLLIRASRARILKPCMNKRAVAAIVGTAAAAGCAVYGFYSAALSDLGAAIVGWGEIMSYIAGEYEEFGAFADMFPRDSAYYAAVYKCAGAFSVVLGVYFLFSFFGDISYITERGLLRKGMLKPEEITAEPRGAKINIYLKSDFDRTKPVMVLRAAPKNLKKLERFIGKDKARQTY